MQWHNRQGAECPPRLPTGKFLLTYREKIGKKKKEKGSKRRKIEKAKVKNLKWGKDHFFFFFFFFFFIFENDLNLFWSTKMEIFYQEEAFHAGRKNQEKQPCPLWKIFLLRLWNHDIFST